MKGLKDMELIIAACVIVFVILYLIFAKDEEYPQKTANSAEKNKEQSPKTANKVKKNKVKGFNIQNYVPSETYNKKIASQDFKYEDCGVSKDKMKEMLIKATSNLSWKKQYVSLDSLYYHTELYGIFAEGKVNIILNEDKFSVICYNDTTEKNKLNLKALIIELNAIKEGNEQGTGRKILHEHYKNMSLVFIIAASFCVFVGWACISIYEYFSSESYPADNSNSKCPDCEHVSKLCLSQIEREWKYDLRGIYVDAYYWNIETKQPTYVIIKGDFQNAFGAYMRNKEVICTPYYINGEWRAFVNYD